MGSMINSFESVVNERTIGLQSYLQEILSHNQIKSDEIILNFLDITNQGINFFLNLISKLFLIIFSYLNFILHSFFFLK